MLIPTKSFPKRSSIHQNQPGRKQNLPLLIGVAGDFCFWAEELSGQSESFPESCSCCSWIGATKGSPLARFACKGADLIAFCEEVMIKHPHAPAYSQGPYLYGMMIYSEAG